MTKIDIFSGFLGAGKTTLIKKLIKEHGSNCSDVEASLAIKEEINDVCAKILDNTSVFKKDAQGEEAFDKFLASVGIVKA